MLRAELAWVRSLSANAAILVAVVLPSVGRKKSKHFRRRIRALGVGIRTGRIAPEPGMARAMHQPLLGEDTTLRVLQHRPSIGIATGNDAPLDLLVVFTVRTGVPYAVTKTCHGLCNH